jgi:ribosomal protein S18 acetylase RimI-like enzyme
MSEIRRLGQEDVGMAASVLGRAFADSPAYLAALDSLAPERRPAALERIKRGFVEAAVRHHQPNGYWIDGRLAGASLVLGPKQYPPSIAAEAWWTTGCLRTGVHGIVSFLRLRSYLGKRHLREPHYYLFVLGVDPELQGKGIGKALLGSLHEKVDAEGACAFLETDKTINVKLYESVGYRVVTDDLVPGMNGLRMWTMRRPPKSAQLPPL